MLELDVVYDARQNRVGILGRNAEARVWLEKDDAQVSWLMNGLASEQTRMTQSLLGEIGSRLAALAAERTGQPVQMHYGYGRVVDHHVRPEGARSALADLFVRSATARG